MTPPTESSASPPSTTGPNVSRVRIEIAARSHQGLVRASNEDSYIVFRMARYLERILTKIPEGELPVRKDDQSHLMVVCDGMGGHQAGEVASRTALVKALELILRSPRWAMSFDDPTTREDEIQALLNRSRGYLAAIHTALRAQAQSDSRLEGMGTTMTGAYSVGTELFVLHVGDSKAYLLRDGRLSQITHDHTVAQQYADLGVIPQEAVAGHHASHMLTRAIGAPTESLRGDLHHLRIENGDRLLLCSDGLTDMATAEQIRTVLMSRASCEEACQSLIDLALAGGGRDNVTAIVASFSVE